MFMKLMVITIDELLLVELISLLLPIWIGQLMENIYKVIAVLMSIYSMKLPPESKFKVGQLNLEINHGQLIL
jgi:hypothetical protein